MTVEIEQAVTEEKDEISQVMNNGTKTIFIPPLCDGYPDWQSYKGQTAQGLNTLH